MRGQHGLNASKVGLVAIHNVRCCKTHCGFQMIMRRPSCKARPTTKGQLDIKLRREFKGLGLTRDNRLLSRYLCVEGGEKILAETL